MKTGTQQSTLFAGRRDVLVLLVVGLAVGMALAGCRGAAPVDEEAHRVLRAMATKLATAEQLAIMGKRAVDPALVEGRNVVETADVALFMKRPNKLAATVVGEDDERNMYYNGHTFTLLDVKNKFYATVPAADTIDGLMRQIEEKFGFALPVAEFIGSDPHGELIENAVVGKYLGEVELDGKACHLLAFKEEFLDWDLWVSVDENLPVRFVVTATAIEGRPKYQLDFLKFDMQPSLSDDRFEFTPAADAVEIPMRSSEEYED